MASISLGQWEEKVTAVGVLYEHHVGRTETQGHLLLSHNAKELIELFFIRKLESGSGLWAGCYTCKVECAHVTCFVVDPIR